jgi:hypothetical protein
MTFIERLYLHQSESKLLSLKYTDEIEALELKVQNEKGYRT